MQAAGACGASTEGHTTMAAGQDATELLGYLSGGRQWAADELMPLVHEVYMKLVDQARVDWQSKTHFKAVAAQAMYRAPVDHARARNREKRGGTWRRVRLYDAFVLAGSHKKDLEPLALQDALEKMRRFDERQTRVVELRLFGGQTSEEAGRILGV